MSVTHFADMIGRTMRSVTGSAGGSEMLFVSTGGDEFRFYNSEESTGNDCDVHIEDIDGSLDWLTGEPITQAEAVEEAGSEESGTWSFLRYATSKGSVTVRWFGTSNGYYSETPSYSVHGASHELKTQQAIERLKADAERLTNWVNGKADESAIKRLRQEVTWLRADLDAAMAHVPGGWRRCRFDNYGKRCTRPDEHWLHGSPEHVWEK